MQNAPINKFWGPLFDYFVNIRIFTEMGQTFVICCKHTMWVVLTVDTVDTADIVHTVDTLDNVKSVNSVDNVSSVNSVHNVHNASNDGAAREGGRGLIMDIVEIVYTADIAHHWHS